MSEATAQTVPLRSLLGVSPPPKADPPPDPGILRAEGFEAGLAAGRAEAAVARAHAEAERHAALKALEAETASLLDAVADDLAGLGLAIATAVLAAEPHTRPETVSALVREALGAAPAEARGRLLLAPGTPVPEPLREGWAVDFDPQVPPGEVQAHLPPRAFHAALGRRLERITEALGLRL